MTRDEYFILIGKQSHAKEELSKLSQEAQRLQNNLQSWVNGLKINKIDEKYASRGKEMIDSLLLIRQNEAYWQLEELHAKHELDGLTQPPAES